MASSLKELLAEEGFKGSRRVTRSRSSFHYGASSEPLYSLEGRFCVSSERTKALTTKSKSDVSQYQITGDTHTHTHTAKNHSLFKRENMDQQLKDEIESKSSSRVKDIYSKQVYDAKRGEGKNFMEKDDAKGSSSVHMLRHSSETEKNMKLKQDSYAYSRSNSNGKGFEERSRNKYRDQANPMQAASSPALDEVAVQALVSILNGYIECFLKDEDFRTTLRHNCFSSLNFIEQEEENITETKVITSLEQAIETIEKYAKEPTIPATYLKRITMQLSIITGLSLNGLKYECTCGIPNFKLSACAHLYLSVVYMMQRKNKVSAKHLLQVFCDSPFQARTILLSELWEHLFSPQLSHLKVWYYKEAQALGDAPNKTRKLKLVQKVYNQHLDSGTHIYAVYYKDWLTEGVESPPIPSIDVPSVSVKGSHSSEFACSNEPFSPQPMVSKKLYDSMFGSSTKPGIYQVKDITKDSGNCVKGSYDSTIVKQTLTYESETVNFTDQDIQDFALSCNTDTKKPKKGNAEEWQKINLGDDFNESCSMQTNLNSHIINALPHQKANELPLRKPNKITSAIEGPYFANASIPQEFICPLTGNLFEEPVTLETGQTFEREAIKAWFEKGNRTCPVTGNTLECVAMPSTNLILKRLIENWKLERFDYLLDLASQTVENSELKNKDEGAVFELENILSSLKQHDKSTFSMHLVTLGLLPFLFWRFEHGNVEEKSHVLSLLLNCIQADSACIYQIAKSVNRKCLLELLHSKETTTTTNAILFLTQLLSMKRRKDVTSFLSGLRGENIFNTVHILVTYLENSSPYEKPLIGVLLLHFDLLVEAEKFNIYREVAANGIAEALDESLNDEKAREKCCRALLILCGHFSCSGKIPIKNGILKQAGYKNENDSLDPDHEDVTFYFDDEENRGEQLLMNLLECLIGDGETPFLKAISRCLDSRHQDLVRACLITVTWLSSSLSMLSSEGLHLPAFIAIISQLKRILENGEVELKTLASLSLLNFSKISECRTLLKTMAEDIAPLLHGLVDVTWSAKQLHAIVSRENL